MDTPVQNARPRSVALLATVCLLVGAAAGCSAKGPATEEVPTVAAEVAEPGADVAVDPEAGSEGETQAKETCHGALDCTFFGLGAVLAAPFWVLGAFLGLVF